MSPARQSLACYIFTTVLIFFILASQNGAIAKSGKRKNVLFLVADDLRNELGVYTGENAASSRLPGIRTPNLDRLAGKSLLFNKAYCQYALCAPSRASTLTSRRPDTTKVFGFEKYFRDTMRNTTTLPQYFKENGYRTIGIGKVFHNSYDSSRDGDPISWTEPPKLTLNVSFYDNITIDKSHGGDGRINMFYEMREGEATLNEMVADSGISELDKMARSPMSGGLPFFLAIGMFSPHTPYYMKKRFFDMYPLQEVHLPERNFATENVPQFERSNPISWTSIYKEMAGINQSCGSFNKTYPDHLAKRIRQGYYGSVSHVDHELGRILDHLDELDLANDTIIAFWSDHGISMGENALWSKNTATEYATRIPMMIRIPGVTDQGMETSSLVELVDLFPSLAEIAGLPKLPICPSNPKASSLVSLCTEGHSFMPLFLDPNPNRRKTAAFSQIRQNHYSIRTSQYRYSEWLNETVEDLPDWNHVLARELYDYSVDPWEARNVAEDPKYTTVVHKLRKQLRGGWTVALPRDA